MTMSPVFECSLDGLASAVRLRYTVWGSPDPVTQTAVYMDGYRISEAGWDDPEVIRKRIELIISDIERATARQAADALDARIDQLHGAGAAAAIDAAFADGSIFGNHD